MKLAVSVRAGTVPAAEVVELAGASTLVGRVVHAHVSTGLTVSGESVVVPRITTLENVNLGVVNLGVDVSVKRAILRAEVLGEGRRPLDTELAMENDNMFPSSVLANPIPTATRLGRGAFLQEGSLDSLVRVEVDRARDVPAVMLVVEAAVDDRVRCNGGGVVSVDEVLDL